MFDFSEFWEDLKRNAADLFTLDTIRAQIQKLRNVGVEFDDVYSKLESYRSITASDPTKYGKYYKLLADGDSIRYKIRSAVDSVAGVVRWVKDNFGTDLKLNDLQAAPLLIPIAVAGGIIVAVNLATGWISEARKEIARMDAVKVAIASAPPEKRAALAAQLLEQKDTSVTGNLSSTAMWLALGAVAIFVLPKLIGNKP